MTSAVLDASAVLALLNSETGAETVLATLGDAVISAVNYSEVIAKLLERGLSLGQARTAVGQIGVQITTFDAGHAERAASLRPHTRLLGLSFADRACLSLAEQEGAPAVTADRNWKRLKTDIQVQLIR